MKSSELIAELQKLDPTGEMEVWNHWMPSGFDMVPEIREAVPLPKGGFTQSTIRGVKRLTVKVVTI